MTRAELARLLEITLAQPEATKDRIERLCAQARELGVRGVCVNGSRVAQAYSLLEDTPLKVTGLVGYPLGASDADAKRYETEVAVDHGAHEIEMVLNTGLLKDGDRRYVLRELRDVVEAADERPVKVAIEAALLTAPELLAACELVLDSGAKCVCTGTGLLTTATPEAVRQLRTVLGEKFGVKASGAITGMKTALALVEAGATRLGSADAVAVLADPAQG